MLTKAVFFAVVLVVAADMGWGADYYVTTGGDDGNDGLDWATAFATIREAVEKANADPLVLDTIHVGAGTYSEHLVLGSNVALLGGYRATGGVTRNSTANPTYIDGNGDGRPVTVMDVSNVTLDGFVIRNGSGSRGGGILVERSSSVTINDTEIANNTSPGDWGGGIAVAESSTDVTITNNEVHGNSTDTSGGGISIWGGCTVLVRGNSISNNIAEEGGGGGIIIDQDCGVTIDGNNAISHNTAGSNGGAILIAGNSSCIIEGNIIEGNTAETYVGGGICVEGADATIRSNTIQSNEALYDWGGGIGLVYAGTVLITGNEIMGNKALGENGYGGGISFFGTPSGLVTRNIISGNASRSGGEGIHIDSGSPVIGGTSDDCNDLLSNGEFDLDYNGDEILTASHNYWGTQDETEIAARIGIGGNGSVIFKPWSDEPCGPEVTGVALRTQGLGEGVPAAYKLDQNRPNPFNPSTTISYDLSEASHVHLDLCNIAGQHVATLVSGYQTAGHHEVAWDGGGFASGVYVYRLVAGQYSESRRMVLLH